MDINLVLEKLSKNEVPSQSLYEKFLQEIDFDIDREYLNFIAKYNGAEGEISSEQYLSLWDIKNILSCNPYYENVKACLNLLFFGTDGSNYGYAFEKITGNVVGIDFLDIGNVAPDTIGSSFEDFLMSFNQHG